MMKEIVSNKFLLVEGNDDKKFFESFMKYEAIENVQVERVKGKPEFQNKIPGYAIRPDFNKIEMLAIIRDANNEGINNAFLSIKNILEKIEEYELIPPPKTK